MQSNRCKDEDGSQRESGKTDGGLTHRLNNELGRAKVPVNW
jgi:hypothetical protein